MTDYSESYNVIIAFDLYGTLLSTTSIASKLGELYGKDKGPELAATWRKYQLEYTWRLNSMQHYLPFSTVTERALRHTIKEAGLELTTDQTEELMHAYDDLSIFPDVGPALEELRTRDTITPVIFSNGTDSMVSSSVQKSKELSPFQDVFKELITVEEIKRFKPAPVVYEHLATKMGKDTQKEESMGSMWLVSGNPFDIVGARAMGMQAAWVDRQGNGWSDALGSEPTVVVKGLGEVVEAVRTYQESRSREP